MAKKSCVIYDSWGTLMQNLPDEMAGILIKMVLEYAFTGSTNPSNDESIDAMFSMIKIKLDEDAEAYAEEIKRRSEAGKKGMASRWNDRKITEDNTVITNDNTLITDDNSLITDDNKGYQSITSITDSVSVSVSEYVSDKDKRKKFVRPTLEDVRSYCQERNNKVDPEAFIDFYESKGWKVGNQPMKDWKSAIRTWERRENNKSSPSGISQQTYDKIHNHKERRYDYEALMKEVLNV